MDARELEERIAAFPAWIYSFRFDNGVQTPIIDRTMANRHEQRRRYFFEPLLALTGGSLAGRKVLDLGCNAGFWSLLAVEAGADFVLGIDAKEHAIEQADLVFEAAGIDRNRYRFEQGDVFACDLDESFDLVLCLGILDQVFRPFELFELMSRAGAESIVIDTQVSRARSSIFEVTSLYQKSDLVDHPLVLIPSREAVVELASQFGFDTVALPLNISDYAKMQDYRRERRLAFICSKRLDLGGLQSAKRPSRVPWWLRDPGALMAAGRLAGE